MAVGLFPLSQLSPLPPSHLTSDGGYFANRANSITTNVSLNRKRATPSVPAWFQSAQRELSTLFETMQTGDKLLRPQGGARPVEFLPYVSQSLAIDTPLL